MCVCEVWTLNDKRHSDYFEQNSKLLIQWWNSSVLSNLYKLKMRWNVNIFPTLQPCQVLCLKVQIKFTIIWLVTMCGYYETTILWVSMIVLSSTSKIANCHSSLLEVHVIVLTAQLHTSVLGSHTCNWITQWQSTIHYDGIIICVVTVCQTQGCYSSDYEKYNFQGHITV